MSVLNPALYDAVCRRLHRPGGSPVKVVHEGEAAEGYYAPDPLRGGKERLTLLNWGESYEVDCVFCGDARRRMSVNHRYGVRDDRTGAADYGLWRCYNEDCQSDPGNRYSLRMQLDVASWVTDFRPAARVPEVKRCEDPLRPVPFPGRVTPLTALPPDHRAVAYLRDRRDFDPAELTTTWEVGVASDMPPGAGWVEGRIVYPVRQEGKYVGYQARYPGDLTREQQRDVPKYVTYGSKSFFVYGLDEAAAAPVWAFFEGCPSVWRYGPGGLACLGKKASTAQADRLAKTGSARPLVFVPDRDGKTEADRLAAWKAMVDSCERILRAGYRGPVNFLPLAEGTDPADHPRDALRAAVLAAAASASR